MPSGEAENDAKVPQPPFGHVQVEKQCRNSFFLGPSMKKRYTKFLRELKGRRFLKIYRKKSRTYVGFDSALFLNSSRSFNNAGSIFVGKIYFNFSTSILLINCQNTYVKQIGHVPTPNNQQNCGLWLHSLLLYIHSYYKGGYPLSCFRSVFCKYSIILISRYF